MSLEMLLRSAVLSTMPVDKKGKSHSVTLILPILLFFRAWMSFFPLSNMYEVNDGAIIFLLLRLKITRESLMQGLIGYNASSDA